MWILEVDTNAVGFDDAVVDAAAAVHVFPLAEVTGRFREVDLRQDKRVRLIAAGGHGVENHGSIMLFCHIGAEAAELEFQVADIKQFIWLLL